MPGVKSTHGAAPTGRWQEMTPVKDNANIVAMRPFTSVRRLPSGTFNARYRPRQGAHLTRTFDTEIKARQWLDSLREELEDGGEVSVVSNRRCYRRGTAGAENVLDCKREEEKK